MSFPLFSYRKHMGFGNMWQYQDLCADFLEENLYIYIHIQIYVCIDISIYRYSLNFHYSSVRNLPI